MITDYRSMDDLKAQLLQALREGQHDRALEVFTDLTRVAVLAEREACAKIYEEIAAKIRARGD